MFSSASSAAWIPGLPPDRAASSSPPHVSPAATTRRRRGLSYLRSYTHNHILSRDSRDSSSKTSPTRTADLPSPSATASPSISANPTQESPTPPANPPRPASPPYQRRNTHPPVIISSETHTLEPPSSLLAAVGELDVVPRILEAGSSDPEPSSTSSLNEQPATAPHSSTSMVRVHAATVGDMTDMPQQERNDHSTTANEQEGSQAVHHQMPSIRFTSHQDPRAQRPSLVFGPQARILPSGKEVIKLGRWSERDNRPTPAANVPSAAPVGFKSKVVSRRHCEFWYASGRWFIKDVKSSSGTFLNHIRLSSPGTESKPFPVNDGDIVQLGIDFKGGEEMIFRCVKIKIELNKGWHNIPSSFNVQSHKRLQELNNHGKPVTGSLSSSQDCSICLGPIAPCQSLFVAPCSHTWHYKCIRVIINGPHWPHFICPNCRTVADLEAELDDPSADGEWEQIESLDTNAVIQPSDSTGLPDPLRLTRQAELSETTDAAPQPISERNVQNETRHIDVGEVKESSDSDLSSGAQHSSEGISVSYADSDASPESATQDKPFPESSHSTVPPVDIAGRGGEASTSMGNASRLENQATRPRRGTVRTPSPSGLSPSVAGVAISSEGPMTPRKAV